MSQCILTDEMNLAYSLCERDFLNVELTAEPGLLDDNRILWLEVLE